MKSTHRLTHETASTRSTFQLLSTKPNKSDKHVKKMLSRLFNVAEDGSSSQSEPEDKLFLSPVKQSLTQKLEVAINWFLKQKKLLL